MLKIINYFLIYLSVTNLVKIQDFVSASSEFSNLSQKEISYLSGKGVINNYRLPIEVQPIKYDLKLNTYLNEQHEKNLTFDGVVKIQISIKNATQFINLHSDNLKIKQIELKNDYNQEIPVSWKHKPDIDLLEIICGSQKLWMPNDNYTIKIKFEGQFLNDMEKGIAGFHTNSYINDKGKKM